MYSLNLQELLQCEPVTLTDMLDAREKRAAKQCELLSIYKLPIICFTLNVPGSYKAFKLAYKTFEEGKKLIKNQLKRYKANTVYEEVISSKTGFEFFVSVDNDAHNIKKIMSSIENSNQLGRIFDIDVLDSSQNKISREDIGMSGRTCILCNDSAHVCSRSKRHSKEELIKKTISILYDYFTAKFADISSSCACKALLYEVATTPKPGLVDRANNGAHTDMDIYTFIDSSAVLTTYFREFVFSGIVFSSDKPKELFKRIRYLGMKAEDDMFKATGNINTHKGLIFSMGIICASMGYLYGNDKNIGVENILELSKDMTSDLMDDLKKIESQNANTYGEKLYAKYGVTGVRGEAATGFLSVKKYGLPILEKLINKGYSINNAGALTLLNLIANVKDTNIITRTSIETQFLIQEKAKKLIDNNIENVSLKDLEELDKEYITMNASPGGCADLLAITYMLYFIMDNDELTN